MSKPHREEVWCEERVIETEIMLMMKFRKCPEDEWLKLSPQHLIEEGGVKKPQTKRPE